MSMLLRPPSGIVGAVEGTGINYSPDGNGNYNITFYKDVQALLSAGWLAANQPNIFFVDGTNGLDSNIGTSPLFPFLTLTAAYNACTAGQNQIVYILPNTVHIGATFTWAKDKTHLIGLTAPIGQASRARFSATAVFTPMFNVTAQGCIFANFEAFFGQTSAAGAAVCWLEQGQRNYYDTVHFAGGGDATQAADASCRSLVIDGVSGQGEHFFNNCVFGLDTVAQVAASATLEMLNHTPRNRFRDCEFANYTTANAPLFLKVGSGGIDRDVIFDRCIFRNSTVGGGTAMSQAFSINSAAGGIFILKNSLVVGPTKLQTTDSALVFGDNAYGAATTAKGLQLTW